VTSPIDLNSLDPPTSWAPTMVIGPNYTPNFGFLALAETRVDLDDGESFAATRMEIIANDISFSCVATAICHFIALGKVLLLPSRRYGISAGTWRGARTPQALVDGICFCGAVRPGPGHPLFPGVLIGSQASCKAIFAEMEGSELALSIDGEVDFQRYRYLWEYRFDLGYELSDTEQKRASQIASMAETLARYHKGAHHAPAFVDASCSNIINGKLVDYGGFRLLSRIPTAPQAAANILPLLDEFSPLDWQVFAHYYVLERGPEGQAVRDCIENFDAFGWRHAIDRREFARARLLLWNVMKFYQSWRSVPKLILSALAICESNAGSDDLALSIYERLTQESAEDDEDYGVLHLNLGKALARAGNNAEASRVLVKAINQGRRIGQSLVVDESLRALSLLSPKGWPQGNPIC
jgi:tetratricopeptide (TPR) repeat protein